jgi:glycosyltransferase involved in cell wall biosynthesis
VVYLHDAEISFKFLFEKLPTVASFQDFVYPDTVGNAMSFDYGDLIVASDYVRACVIDSIGQYRGTIGDRIHVVPNGVDLDHFQPTTPLPWQHALKKQGHVLIGYPHRPDPNKGLIQALQTLEVLKRQLPSDREPLLLVPQWMDTQVTPDDGHIYRTIYDDAITFADSRGLKSNLILHEWLDELLPRYYSGCDVTLSLGTFVEAFGNVPLESLACGCSTVVVSVGAHAGKLPAEFCTEVAPGDVEAAANAIVTSLSTPLDVQQVRSYLSEAFGLRRMCEGYRTVIESAQLRASLPFRRPSALSAVRMPAWCRFFGTRLYNDYQHGYCTNEQVSQLVMSVCKSQPQIGSTGNALTLPEDSLVEAALKGGYLVRC